MSQLVLPFSLPGFHIDQMRVVGSSIIVEASACQPNAHCPSCQTPSDRIHSQYIRTPRDLPVSEQSLRLILRVRRFFCNYALCPKRTFAEPLPELVPFRAQRTLRLSRTPETLGFALGGEAGARLSHQLRMPTSASSFLRIVRRASCPSFATPRILGVDDFALRRGRVYGTILVDLEQHRPVDLLPDRSADTLANWLRDHPGVEVIARDRSTEYTRGANEGAPSARQVADRWHVRLNLREALERTLTHKHAQLCQLPLLQEAHTHSSITNKPKRIRRRTASEHVRQAASRSARYTQYQKVHQLVEEGVSLREIARQLKMSRVTVRAFAVAEAFPERAARRPSESELDMFASYLHQRWQEGCRNGSQLWREICAQGYTGGQRQLLRWVHHVRISPSATGPRPKQNTAIEGQTVSHRARSV